MEWCELCRDHYETDHFNEDDEHLVGKAFGPTGWTLARIEELQAALQDQHELVRAYERELGMPHAVFGACLGCAALAEGSAV